MQSFTGKIRNTRTVCFIPPGICNHQRVLEHRARLLYCTERMEFDGGYKRGRSEAALNGNGGAKRHKLEGESFGSGIGSKSKPCTKFFSTSGCPFGESCHFLHYVPGGFKAAVSQMPSLGINPPPPHHHPSSRSSSDAPSPTVKNRICNKYNTAEGCKFGDKCHFAHGEWELGKPSAPSYDDPHAMTRHGGRYEHHHPPPPHPQGPATASFGATATAKIKIDAKLTGAIIGKNGVHSKQVCRTTGAKLSIRDHESDPESRNIELEGSFEQIQRAHAMVQELIGNARSSFGPPGKRSGGHQPRSNFKTKLCDNFTKGTCTFGDKCHFAHGAHELNTSAG